MKIHNYNFLRFRIEQGKKQINVFLLVFFCITPLFSAPCGDVNSNGLIDIVDALMTSQYYVGLNPRDFDEYAADVNGDNMVQILDALLIAQYCVEIIPEFPGCAIPTPTSTAPPTPSNPPPYNEYQAEDANWSDGAAENFHSGYTGFGYVNTTNIYGCWIEWTLDLPPGRLIECTFRYANGSVNDRTMELSVNGNAEAVLAFPSTGNWITWATEKVRVQLTSSSVSCLLRLTATNSEGAPGLDKMEIDLDCCYMTPEPVD